MFGSLKYSYVKYISDLTITEHLIFIPLFVFIIFFGIHPINYLNNLEYSLSIYFNNFLI